MKVEVNRGACCHVAGDIDFDKHNNLWMVDRRRHAGDVGRREQQPAAARHKTDEIQTVSFAARPAARSR